MADKKPLSTLQSDFEVIRDERRPHANTAERIGNALLSILPHLGGDIKAESYIQIGSIRIGYDSQNNALKVYKVENGQETAANLYALGAVSALGAGSISGGGGVDMATVWTALANNTTEQVSVSHLTTALAPYVTSSQLSTTLGAYATQSWVSGNFALQSRLSDYMLRDVVDDTTYDSQDRPATKAYNGDAMVGQVRLGADGKVHVRYDALEIYTPGSLSDLDNDLIPSWALTPAKPTYGFSELTGTVTNAQLAGSITADKLAGSIPNAKLTNSAVTVNGTNVSLGGSVTTAKWGTARTLWGQTVDGSGDVNGSITIGTSFFAEEENFGFVDSLHVALLENGVDEDSFPDIADYASPQTGYLSFVSTYDGSPVVVGRDMYLTDLDSHWLDLGTGNISAHGNIQTSPSDGAYVQIGSIRIGYDSRNNALKVYKVENGQETAANLYALGAVSALGAGSISGGGGVDMATVWTALANNTTEQVSVSHLTTALAPYVTSSQLSTTLGAYATQSWVSGNFALRSSLSDYMLRDVVDDTTYDSQDRPATKAYNGDAMVGQVILGADGKVHVRYDALEIYTPGSLSDLDNDLIPAWALTPAKPTYGFSELTGTVTNAQLAGSITADKLTGSIPNAKLTNSAVTVNGTNVSLGGSVTTAKWGTARTLWGQTVDGSGDVNGSMTGVTAIANANTADPFLTFDETYAEGWGAAVVNRCLLVEGDAILDSVMCTTLSTEEGVSASGNIHTDGGDIYTTAGNIRTSTSDGAYVQIGSIRIGYDSRNNALKVYKVENGQETAANLYALGAVSALGAGSISGGGGVDMATVWTALANNTTEQVSVSHLTTALAPYVTSSQLSTTLGAYATQSWVSGNFALRSSLSNYLSLSGSQTVTGQKTFNTNSNTLPLIIARMADPKESLQIGVEDLSAVFHLYQDETYADFVFRGTYADTETGQGAAAGEGIVTFRLRSSEHNIYIDNNKVLHTGNYSSYALPLSGGTMTGRLMSQEISPSYDNTYSLGSKDKQWADLRAVKASISGDLGVGGRLSIWGTVQPMPTTQDDGTVIWPTFGSDEFRWANIATKGLNCDGNIIPSSNGSHQLGMGNWRWGLVAAVDGDFSGRVSASNYVSAGVYMSAPEFRGSLNGNASSATRATQDGSGNTITSTYLTKNDAQNTYLPLVGGTLTGRLYVKGNILPLSTTSSDGNVTWPTLGSSSNRWANVVTSGVNSAGNIVPSATNSYQLGTSSLRWKAIVAGSGDFSSFVKAATYVSAETYMSAPEFRGNATSATKLAYPRTIWGQSFDGTQSVSGAITSANSIEFNNISSSAGHGGYLDFHYNGSTADYTSRIIEDASGRINVNHQLYVLMGGNVGVGTSSPSYKLDIAGSLRATGSAVLSGSLSVAGLTSLNSALSVQDDITVGGEFIAQETSFGFIDNLRVSLLEDGVDNADYPNISTYASQLTGYLSLIGTSDGSPIIIGNNTFLTDLNNNWLGLTAGDITANGTLSVLNDATFANNRHLFIRNNGGLRVSAMVMDGGNNLIVGAGMASASVSYATFVRGGNVVLQTYGTSNYVNVLVANKNSIHASVGIYSESYVSALGQNTSSDIRMKDVADYAALPMVEDVANAPAIHYTWKHSKQLGMQVGSVAQYWQNVLPEAVREDNGGMLSMQYGVIALLASIATAKKVVDHEQRIRELERENFELRNEIEQLKSA